MDTHGIDRSLPMPVWHQLEQALAAAIGRGEMPPGSRLPNEAAIAARFGVNRHTARRALSALAEKGTVRIRRGVGTFVEPPVLDYPVTGRTRFTATLREQNRAASHELLDASEMVAPTDVARQLRLRPAERVTLLHTIGSADGIPITLGQTYVPVARFPDAASLYKRHRSMTAVFAKLGVPDFRRVSTIITPALPSEADAALLRQSRRTPVLMVVSVDADPAGRPVSLSRVLFAGERVQFVVDTKRGG